MAKAARNKKEFEGQHEDEEVELVFRQHPIVLRYALLVGLVIFTLSSLPLAFTNDIGAAVRWLLLGTGLAIAVFMYRWLSWYFSLYIVTNERLIQIKQKGLFERKVVDISLNKIQSVNYEIKGVQATSFHYGTITVQTYVGDLVLSYIHTPAEVHQKLVKIIRIVEPVDPTEQGAGS